MPTRHIVSKAQWYDEDKIKIYHISQNLTQNYPSLKIFLSGLYNLKQHTKAPSWSKLPAFTIFHEGVDYLYLVLCCWNNKNELVTSVSIYKDNHWLYSPEQYSFCLYDLEVMGFERNNYIKLVSGEISLDAYREARLNTSITL